MYESAHFPFRCRLAEHEFLSAVDGCKSILNKLPSNARTHRHSQYLHASLHPYNGAANKNICANSSVAGGDSASATTTFSRIQNHEIHMITCTCVYLKLSMRQKCKPTSKQYTFYAKHTISVKHWVSDFSFEISTNNPPNDDDDGVILADIVVVVVAVVKKPKKIE